MKEIENYIKDTKKTLNQIESIILQRNENFEICLWKTLDSTMNILFIFTPKLNPFHSNFLDHLTTILNASSLLSSVIQVLLSRFDKGIETMFVVKQLIEKIKKMRFSMEDDKLYIMLHIHSIVKSILIIYLNKKERKKGQECDPTLYYQGGMQSARVCQSQTKDIHYDTVSKRFIRTLRKSISFEDDASPRTKIDQDRASYFHQNDFQLKKPHKFRQIQDHLKEILLKEGKEGSIFHLAEDGRDVLILEMVSHQRLQVKAGTTERLLIRLADESRQDLDYVDTFILSHGFFMESLELLENLKSRFHLEALPGELDYFKRWQRCIQVKVLNVISRWVKLQCQDFIRNPSLLSRLECFLSDDVPRAGFTIEADMIKKVIDREKGQARVPNHQQLIPSFSSKLPQRRQSLLSGLSEPTELFLSIQSKEIAKYLTLADFYILKCIRAQDYLAIYYPQSTQEGMNYIQWMTKRANTLSQWVIFQINLQKTNSKQRRIVIRKMIDIAKFCLGWNNYHTSMVITMGLTQLAEFKTGDWPSSNFLPSRDLLTFKNLVKYLNVGNNMSYYRTAFKKTAKAPCIPFFPIILKDLTFLMDGNVTKQPDGLINFSKFRILVHSIHTLLYYTMETYYFASDLTCFPFFPQSIGHPTRSLDQVALFIEAQINYTNKK